MYGKGEAQTLDSHVKGAGMLVGKFESNPIKANLGEAQALVDP